jgi:PKHD-type hydroxylase
MLIAIPDILDVNALCEIRALIDDAEWVDGAITAGHQSTLAKNNNQLPEESAAAQAAGNIVLEGLGKSPLFFAAALPAKVYPPLFNRYNAGHEFRAHIDNAVRIQPGSDFRVRTDLSATLFLADPDSYDGGELVIDGQFGIQRIKLPAGHMVLYPASSLHHVEPITRGIRIASFFWIQSMVRNDDHRRSLFELDSAIQTIAIDRGHADAAIVQLTGVYHNLLRQWADV